MLNLAIISVDLNSSNCFGTLFDQLVGTGQQRLWEGDAHCLCALKVDKELQSCLLHGKVARLRALEDFVNHNWDRAAQNRRLIRPIGQQTTSSDPFAIDVDSRQIAP